MTQGGCGVVWIRWTQGIWSPGVPGFSINGVGLVDLWGELGVTSSSSPWDGLYGWWVVSPVAPERGGSGGAGEGGGEEGERKKKGVPGIGWGGAASSLLGRGECTAGSFSLLSVPVYELNSRGRIRPTG